MAKFVDTIEWEDCAHLLPPVMPAETLAEFEKSLAPHQREARRRGIPSIGSGAVYPVPDDDLLVEPFSIPAHWGQGYGLDVGWRVTAACFLAHDPDRDIFYVTGEYYGREKEPIIHAHAIRSMMPYALKGAIDPAAEGSSQVDGQKLIQEYKKLGLELKKADNAVEAGIHSMLTRMQSGRFKVFNHCDQWLKEKRLYRRRGDMDGSQAKTDAARGKIVKTNDHLMDASRYVCYTKGVLRTAPAPKSERLSLMQGEF